MKKQNIESDIMRVMSCGSIFSKNCKNFCLIILNIFLALIREGGKGGGKTFITLKNTKKHLWLRFWSSIHFECIGLLV